MSIDLLEKVRKLNGLVKSKGVQFTVDELCNAINVATKSSVLVISNKGVVIGFSNDVNSLNETTELDGTVKEYTETLIALKENISLKRMVKDEQSKSGYVACMVPLIAKNQRVGTLIVYRDKKVGSYFDNDIVLIEYCSALASIKIFGSLKDKSDDAKRKIEAVKLAIGTLSYSEVEATNAIFKEINDGKGLVVASKVADKVGITRSVIVNALRKLESAGLIESRSLGMKGTFIKILSDELMEELNKK